MPLALVALASALDRDKIDVVIIDGRLEADPVAAVVAAARGALCVGVTVLTGAPIHDALAVSRAVKAAEPSCRSCGAAGIRRCSRPSASTNRRRHRRHRPGRRHVPRHRRSADRRRACCRHVNRRPLKDLNAFPAHDYSLIPGRALLRAQGRAADRLHLVAGLPLPLRVLRRSGGVRSRLDRPGAGTHRRRDRVPASALRDGRRRVPGRDVLHACAARRRAGRRVPEAELCRSRGRRRCAPIRRAGSATSCLRRRFDRACVE